MKGLRLEKKTCSKTKHGISITVFNQEKIGKAGKCK
jgi:hypothetical protein